MKRNSLQYLKGEAGNDEWMGVEVEVVGWDIDPDRDVIVASPSDELEKETSEHLLLDSF
jgi:hypothetical protein